MLHKAAIRLAGEQEKYVEEILVIYKKPKNIQYKWT